MPDNGPPEEDLLHFASLEEVFGGFSHEMAQPLNAIVIAAQVIQLKVERSSLPEAERTFFNQRLEIISSQVQRATQMIGSLRSFSDSATDFYLQGTNISHIFQRIYDLMQNQFVKRGIGVALQCAGNLPPVKKDLHLVESVVVQCLAYARDSVGTIARWHESQAAPYRKEITAKLVESHRGSVLEIEWSLGTLPGNTVPLDPKSRVGLVTAALVLRSRDGELETSINRVVARIP
ncbi:MAG: HAMP domain-containing histidine kinase [Desulfomonile tiedjei]|nr:HAMP domain-containing histidine kinase [Desulfomonile tiedjei]